MPTDFKGWMEFLAALGTWAGACATIFAVWFLLRLQRQERPKLLLVVDPEDAGALQYVRSEAERTAFPYGQGLSVPGFGPKKVPARRADQPPASNTYHFVQPFNPSDFA